MDTCTFNPNPRQPQPHRFQRLCRQNRPYHKGSQPHKPATASLSRLSRSLTGPNRGPVIPAPIGEREREPPQEYPKTVTPPQTHTTPKPPNPAQPKKPQNPQTTQIKFPTKQKTYAYNFDHRRNRSGHTTLIPTAQGADQRMAVTSTTVQPHGIHAESYRLLMAVLLTALCVCLFVCGIS